MGRGGWSLEGKGGEGGGGTEGRVRGGEGEVGGAGSGEGIEGEVVQGRQACCEDLCGGGLGSPFALLGCLHVDVWRGRWDCGRMSGVIFVQLGWVTSDD